MPEGGTVTKDIPPKKQEVQALADDRIIELAGLGQKIEAHYGSEQDIEWGFVNNSFYILQSRPITSLFPIPPAADDKLHLYISFGHIQMMTDAMKPLAIAVLSNITNFLKTDPASTDNYFIYFAGGRAFADITGPLLFKPLRNLLLKVFKGMDELMAAAVFEVVKRNEFRKLKLSKRDVLRVVRKIIPVIVPAILKVQSNLYVKDPGKAREYAAILIRRIVRENEQNIFGVAGADRIRLIRKNMGTLLPEVLPKVAVYLITGVLASGSLEKKLKM